MTQKEQEIAIAKALSPDLKLCPIHHSYSCCNRKSLNYTSDLNAMMEPCKLLASKGWRCEANMETDGTWECFFTKPDTNITSGRADATHYGAGDTLALALAEAFLKTLGLWK